MPEQDKLRGKLWLTRADHLRVGSSPPIDDKFGDNICKGDSLSDAELAEFYRKELKGIHGILSIPKEQRGDLQVFLDGFGSEIAYYRGRGMDVSDAEKLLKEIS